MALSKKMKRKVVNEFEKDMIMTRQVFFCPNTLISEMRDIASKQGMSVSQLIGVAIGNEMVKPKELRFKFDMKTPSYLKDYDSTVEARRIFNFMNLTPKRYTTRPALALMRYKIGIDDVDKLNYGIDKLIESGLIKEINAPITSSGYVYDENHKALVIIQDEVEKKYL